MKNNVGLKLNQYKTFKDKRPQLTLWIKYSDTIKGGTAYKCGVSKGRVEGWDITRTELLAASQINTDMKCEYYYQLRAITTY